MSLWETDKNGKRYFDWEGLWCNIITLCIYAILIVAIIGGLWKAVELIIKYII